MEDIQKWEFGSTEWCEFCGNLGVQMIKNNVPDLAGIEWGFSEIYTHAPQRILGGRTMSAYHFMVKDGEATGGVDAPEECRELPGFHVEIPWGAIAHASSFFYGRQGQAERSADEGVLFKAIQEAVGKPNPLGLKRMRPYWHPEIARALGKGAEEGGGLHNETAKRLIHSPEVANLPQTKWGVPIWTDMSEQQREEFLKLIGL